MKPNRNIVAFLTGLAGLFPGAAPSSAQDASLLVEFQGGVAVPVGDFADGDGPGEGTAAGPSLQMAFVLPRGRWSPYIGFHQHRFGCEDAGCVPDGRYVSTGFHLGLRILPFSDGPVVPWIRLGGVAARMETGDLTATSLVAGNAGVTDLGFGGQAGVGFMVGLGRSAAWSASALASTVDTHLPAGDALPLRYLSVHTGVTLVF